MAKTVYQRAGDNLRIAMEALKVYWNTDDEGLAKKLGCSANTISRIRTEPLKGSREVSELIREYLRTEERKRYA